MVAFKQRPWQINQCCSARVKYSSCLLSSHSSDCMCCPGLVIVIHPYTLHNSLRPCITLKHQGKADRLLFRGKCDTGLVSSWGQHVNPHVDACPRDLSEGFHEVQDLLSGPACCSTWYMSVFTTWKSPAFFWPLFHYSISVTTPPPPSASTCLSSLPPSFLFLSYSNCPSVAL